MTTEKQLTNIARLMDEHEKPFVQQLQSIGQAIGYGRAQQILGELWDEMLAETYGVPPGRGRMGVTVKDKK